MKNPLTPAGIELATFRLVAQHLNHCATAVKVQTFIMGNDITYNNNNNNYYYYYYLLQLGCYPVAVVILHVNKT